MNVWSVAIQKRDGLLDWACSLWIVGPGWVTWILRPRKEEREQSTGGCQGLGTSDIILRSRETQEKEEEPILWTGTSRLPYESKNLAFPLSGPRWSTHFKYFPGIQSTRSSLLFLPHPFDFSKEGNSSYIVKVGKEMRAKTVGKNKIFLPPPVWVGPGLDKRWS